MLDMVIDNLPLIIGLFLAGLSIGLGFYFGTKNIKEQYQIEADRIISQVKLQAKLNETERRDQLFLEKRAEKVVALFCSVSYGVNALKIYNGLEKGHNIYYSEYVKLMEVKGNPNPLDSKTYEKLIFDIHSLDQETKLFHEYSNEYQNDHGAALNKLFQLIKIEKQNLLNKSTTLSLESSGWSIFVDDDRIVEYINQINEKGSMAQKFISSNDYEESEKLIEEIETIEKDMIQLLRNQILKAPLPKTPGRKK